ncbi:MAG: hypothetical protein K5683_09595 [Prevotella sp.]|nr:hypothetical protein [Prevotella sp.]
MVTPTANPLPEAFLQQTRTLLGDERFTRYREALAEEAPVSIRINPQKLSIEQLPAYELVPWCPNGCYLPQRPNFTFDPLLHAGCYYVQEAASMFLHTVMEQHLPDDTRMALDLCAAPGGKSTLMRSLLPDHCLLYSNEPIRQRASILSENIQKWGHGNCIVTNCYPRDYVVAGLTFDLILCDVPCSGEGMFRKDPLTIGEWSLQKVMQCAQLQRDIVCDAWQCLRDGGLLVYSTCTFNTQENEENIRWIQQTLDADILAVDIASEWGITGSLLADFHEPVYRFLPGITRSEGLFVCVLRKKGGKTQDGASARRHKPRDRKNANLNIIFDGREPREKAVGNISLDYHDAISYLQRQALRLDPDAPRGLLQVCYQGHPLGLVKNIGSRANNLYPKEWAIRSTHLPEQPFSILEPFSHDYL